MNEFETATVNELSVFNPLKIYSMHFNVMSIHFRMLKQTKDCFLFRLFQNQSLLLLLLLACYIVAVHPR